MSASNRGDIARVRAQTLTEIGRTHFNQRRYREALASFDQALAADPSYTRALVAKAHVLKMVGRADEGLRLVDEVIARDPGYALAYSTRGSALQTLGRAAEARASYERAVELAPDDALVQYNFACFWALEGDADKARRHLARAIELEPGRNTRAAVDPDFAPFRDEEWFQRLTAFKAAP